MAIALKIAVTSANDCRSFTVTDATGAYSASNLGGYGAPNFTVGTTLTSTITTTKFGTSSPYIVNTYSTFPNTNSPTYIINNTDVGFTSTQSISDGIYLIRYDLTGQFSITAVSQGSKTFQIGGDKTGVFAVGDTFTVTGSTGNNATYTITVITLNAGNTIFTVAESIASSTADGKINYSAHTSIYQMFYSQAQGCYLDKLKDLEVPECDECMEKQLALLNKIDKFLTASRYAALCGKPNKAQALLDYTNTLCQLVDCDSCNED